MKYTLLSLLVLLTLSQCKKIPERSFIDIQAVSVNGTPLQEGQGIELPYGSEADVVFKYDAKVGVEYAYIQLTEEYYGNIEASDDARIINHPKKGDKSGSFTYHVTTEEQFDPPIGNTIYDSKALSVVIMNEDGIAKFYTISVKVL